MKRLFVCAAIFLASRSASADPVPLCSGYADQVFMDRTAADGLSMEDQQAMHSRKLLVQADQNGDRRWVRIESTRKRAKPVALKAFQESVQLICDARAAALRDRVKRLYTDLLDAEAAKRMTPSLMSRYSGIIGNSQVHPGIKRGLEDLFENVVAAHFGHRREGPLKDWESEALAALPEDKRLEAEQGAVRIQREERGPLANSVDNILPDSETPDIAAGAAPIIVRFTTR